MLITKHKRCLTHACIICLCINSIFSQKWTVDCNRFGWTNFLGNRLLTRHCSVGYDFTVCIIITFLFKDASSTCSCSSGKDESSCKKEEKRTIRQCTYTHLADGRDSGQIMVSFRGCLDIPTSWDCLEANKYMLYCQETTFYFGDKRRIFEISCQVWQGNVVKYEKIALILEYSL